jgi:hypothetical protein
MKLMNIYMIKNWNNCSAYKTQYSNTDIIMRPSYCHTMNWKQTVLQACLLWLTLGNPDRNLTISKSVLHSFLRAKQEFSYIS